MYSCVLLCCVLYVTVVCTSSWLRSPYSPCVLSSLTLSLFRVCVYRLFFGASGALALYNHTARGLASFVAFLVCVRLCIYKSRRRAETALPTHVPTPLLFSFAASPAAPRPPRGPIPLGIRSGQCQCQMVIDCFRRCGEVVFSCCGWW